MKLTVNFSDELEIQHSHYTSGSPHLVFTVRALGNLVHVNLPPEAALTLAKMIEAEAHSLLKQSLTAT